MNNEEFKKEALNIGDQNISNYPNGKEQDSGEILELNMGSDKFSSLKEAIDMTKSNPFDMANILNKEPESTLMPEETEIEKPLDIPEPTPMPTLMPEEKSTAEIVDDLLNKSVNIEDLRDMRDKFQEIDLDEQSAIYNSNEMTPEKAKQKNLGMINRANRAANRMNQSGFARGFLFTLLAGFAAGAIFAIGYMAIALGDLTFTI